MRIVFCLLSFYLVACNEANERKNNGRVVIDALGRQVGLPDSVTRIVCLRSSAIRLVTYAGGAHLICGIEESESEKRHEFTHLFAYPELVQRPVIGPRMGGDAELIVSVRPNLIFMASTTVNEANELQKRINIPVVAIEYGDLGRRRDIFFESLKLIGKILHTEKRVDSLIGYIRLQLNELKQRVKGKERRVYVGGISYKGQKGLTSTDPYYAALDFLEIENVASCMDTAAVSPITGAYIDWEQLMTWNPEVVFVDAAGWSLIRQELLRYPKIFELLDSYQLKQFYLLWPYNNYHTNFEVMLLNAWYIGKVLFPSCFEDISMEKKTEEVLDFFVGKPIVSDLERSWGKYRNLFED